MIAELKRKGISVIELLIVIIVISILAAMLFFSSTEAVQTARATAIINNLKKMKDAINLWYMDNRDRFYYTDNGYFIALNRNADGTWIKDSTKKPEAGKLHNYFYNHRDEVAVYFDASGVNFNDYKEGDADWTHGARDRYYASTGNYAVYFGYGNRKIYVVAKIADRNNGSEAVLRQKLKARAKSAGLLWYDFKVSGADDKLDNKDGPYNGEYANVMMEAVDLSPWSKP